MPPGHSSSTRASGAGLAADTDFAALAVDPRFAALVR